MIRKSRKSVCTLLLSGISIIALLLPVLFMGCMRGRPKEKPPIHIIPDMDNQKKYNAQSESRYFPNGSAMREPVPGTIAQGQLKEDDEFYAGKTSNGDYITQNPVPATMTNLQRGRERFNIYCAPCHSQNGDGKSIMVVKKYLPPPNFHDQRVRDFDDGYIFTVISHGVRNMPSYAHQIPVDDRWAIVNYVRALQRSQNATINDIPQELREKL